MFGPTKIKIHQKLRMIVEEMKKDERFFFYRSIKESGMTKSPGAIFSCKDPQAEDTIT